MGTLSLVAPLVLFDKSRLWAGTGFHLLPSFHHHSTQHNNTTQTVTVTLTSTFPVHYTDTHPTGNVVCPSVAWFGNRPHSTPSIHLAWNPKHVIVQRVGIGKHTHAHTYTHTHTHTHTHTRAHWKRRAFTYTSVVSSMCWKMHCGRTASFSVNLSPARNTCSNKDTLS